MKCSNNTCGFETIDKIKFCPDCGFKLISNSTERVVRCSGRNEDGSLCNAELNLALKFCGNCGTKIDPQLVCSTTEKCNQCGTVYKGQEPFCGECGLKKGQQYIPTPGDNQESSLGARCEDKMASPEAEYQDVCSISETDNQSAETFNKKRTDNQTEIINDLEVIFPPSILPSMSEQNVFPANIVNASPTLINDDNNDAVNTEDSGDFQQKDLNLSRDNDAVNTEDSGDFQKNDLNLSRDNDVVNTEDSGDFQQKDLNLSRDNDAVNTEDSGDFQKNDLNMSRENDVVNTKDSGDFQQKDLNLSRDNDVVNTEDSEEFQQKDFNLSGETLDTESNRRISYIIIKEDENQGMQSSENTSLTNESETLMEDNRKNLNEMNNPQMEIVHSNANQLKINDTDTEANENDSSESIYESTSEESDKDQDPDSNLEDKQSKHPLEEASSKGEKRKKKRPCKQNDNEKMSKKKKDLPSSNVGESRSAVDLDTSNNNTQFVFGQGQVLAEPEADPPPTSSDRQSLFTIDKEEKETQHEGKGKQGGKSRFQKVKQFFGFGKDKKSEQVSDSDDDNMDMEQGTENAARENDQLSRRQKRNRKKAKKQTDNNSQTSQSSLFMDWEDRKYNNTSNKDADHENKNSSESFSSNKNIDVFFHVFVSEEFKFDPEKQRVILRIGNDCLGGWSRKDRILKVKRKIKENVFELEYSMKIPANIITLGQKLHYKYVIEQDVSDPSTKGDAYTWENYTKGGQTGKDINRTCTLLFKWKNLDTWHQYDGFVEKEPETWYGYVKDLMNWKTKLIAHAEMSLELSCQSLFEGDMIDTSIHENIEKIFHSHWKIYCSDAQCWGSGTTQKNFKKDFGGHMISVLIDMMSLTKDKKEHFERRITLALSAVYAFKTLELVDICKEKAKCICKSLLMENIPGQNKCPELEIANKLFPGEKRQKLAEAILMFVTHLARHTNVPSWLYLMPWIHFLYENVQPYETPEVDINHDGKVPKWWGIQKLGKDPIEYFKGKTEWDISIENVLECIQPLFTMDYLLPRTFMAVIQLKQLEKVVQSDGIPQEVIFATLIYYMKSTRPRTASYITTDEQTLKKCIDSFLNKMVDCNDKMADEKQLEMRLKIAKQLLTESCKSTHSSLMAPCAHIFTLCAASVAVFQKEARKLERDADPVFDYMRMLQAGLEEVLKWMKLYYQNWRYYLEDNLQDWNSLVLPQQFLSEQVREFWNETIQKHLSNTLENQVCRDEDSMIRFVELYCVKADTYSPYLQECLSAVAFKSIAAGYSLDYGKFTDRQNKRFGLLLSNFFISEWKKFVITSAGNEDELILKHVLSWPPFPQFIKINYTDEKMRSLLLEECIVMLVKSDSVIQSRITALLSGEVTVGDLNLISQNIGKFTEIAKMLKIDDKTQTKDFLLKLTNIRKREMKAFEEQAETMGTFTTLCAQLSVDVRELDEALKKQNNLQMHQVKEFCRPADIHKVLEQKDFVPDLCAFKVSRTLLNMLPDLHMCNRSSIFVDLWEKQCKAKDEECKTLDDVVTNIWKPVKQGWDEIANKLQDGSITFQRMEKHLGRIYKEDYKGMQKELLIMKIKENVIRERLDQLQKYRHIGACVKGAKVILKFKKEFNLTGDFKQIHDLAEDGKKIMEMKEFNDNVMKTCEILKEVTDIEANSLAAFVNCGKLVKWLRQSMKSGLKELKVFVDLAFMSAGDEPINIKRVQCLHSAVTGYAPLIFDLKPTVDYKDLLTMCGLVWKELASDHNLPQKLLDTNNQLEWLKDIKKAHGSVEVTSLIQSDAINDNGIYTVGRKASKNKTGEKADNKMELEGSLKLTVSEIEGKRQQRNYSYRNLQDLQSRLMLVAGKAEKGTDSVDRFTSIFDSVIRLSNVNNKLCAAGCVLFKDWTARFLCDRKKPVCAVLEFGHGEGSPTLKAKRDKEDLVVIVPKIAKFMEECLEDWLKYIKKKRSQYIHLNYFTIDQLVILQKELVKMGSEEQPSLWIYPLLSAVKRNCTQVDVLTAMEETKHEIDKDVDMKSDDGDEIVDDEDDSADSEDVLRQKFIKELADAGYDEGLALKALRHVDADQIEDGIVWCMNHEDEMPEEEPTQAMEQEGEPTTEKTTSLADTFQGWSQSTTSIQSLIRSNLEGLEGTKGSSVDSLLEDLQCLWSQFKGSISSNIKDYLNLEHLGMILKNLAARETSRIFREFPPSFQEGSPNLIICPSSDVLNTALSLYMLEKDQPLPQPDEVLMCTPQTRIDEVDIFWRRAIFGGGKKIHCLVNADFLDFDVSDAAERYLEKYIQETNYNRDTPRYRLVVICGSDNEYRSRIVASLDKHRRPALPLNSAQLREYLAIKLQLNKSDGPIKPAAWVDFNKSTVRVVKSWRAGVGKTLYKSRRENDLARLNGPKVNVKTVSIPLQEKVIDLHHVITRLLEHTLEPGTQDIRLFHIDVAHEVQDGVDYFLFNLLVLGSLTDKTGFVWRKSPRDLYIIETLPLMIVGNNRRREEFHYVHQMLNILPDMTCRSPMESLNVYSKRNQPDGYTAHDQLFDQRQFESTIFQRPYQYLYRLDQGGDLRDVHPQTPEGNAQLCLQTLLRHCGVEDPSWAELHHFVWFLNTQLRDFEQNSFVGVVAAQDLPGFAQFVMRFLIQMSRDFSTRSLNMSEESPGLRLPAERIGVREGQEEEDDDGNQALEQYQLRRTWESSPHPYLFFNADHFTFTFLGFFIDRASGNLIDQSTNQVLEAGIMHQKLYDSLVRNFVPITENFDRLPRDQKITKMCNVMGITMPHDPDDTYELTTDNVKKIMAIYMRFRCDIPVIIMGETGCGKTRLVKFMCGLQMPPGVDKQNMILMKVHGGTTNADIIKKVREAEAIAQRNVAEIGPHMYTVLFFDEANTTESIGLIKEIMCDRSMEGQKLTLCENLKMVAACNPYRKHSEELIKKLEQAGLGYHVDADNTMDKLGRVPMRRLVYRVQPLPQSLLPLVWDFGQLNTQVEDLYIRQMVKRYIRDDRLPGIPNLIEVLSAILTASQDYMRDQKDECSFVSLRDVDRVLSVMSWFYEQSQDGRTLFNKMDALLGAGYDTDSEDEDSDEEESMEPTRGIQDVTRALVLSLGVCYHACLKTRDQYREHVAPYFTAPCVLSGGADQIEEEINCCQDVFLENVELENNIARNMALKENLFMMVVCIELRIPLFLVGKPGSSKSLAKTIASDAMQGNASRKDLFKELKQAQMVSFQCSPLSTPDGIVGTFRQCAQFQKDKDLDTFVSIVVLDEVGLAEDSPRMPLKTLHPLLEDGCQGDEKPEPYMKVAFIGISNWALDPAKMNRGILVQREVPDLEELENSARGISRRMVLQRIEPLISPMCQSYLTIFQRASINMREFFGLRDFYSLVKMVNAFAEKSKQTPTWFEMLHAIKRNFGGLEQEKVDPVECFKEKLVKIINIYDQKKDTDPDCSAAGLIEACLFERNRAHRESRYLLLLTENYGSLNILQQQIMSRQEDIKPITIFGSSFRSDQEYTQVCRNINKIKVCMETGNTVVLLNLENLYESLYDALNQYYVYFGGERYVDLGLGTHRVKCPVHKKFRLIVVAEKQTVYDKFPIPLINRLEKHFLTINTLLSKEQQALAQRLEDWARQFVKQNEVRLYQRAGQPSSGGTVANRLGNVFMGYHDDTCAAIILQVWETTAGDTKDADQILSKGKKMLLWVATPDAVVRLGKSALPVEEQKELHEIYFKQQKHDSIVDYLHHKLVVEEQQRLFVQVTTHSKLLATFHKVQISEVTHIPQDRIMLLDTLSSFDTEQQFSNKIQHQLQNSESTDPCLLIIQCDSGDINANLVACARYCVMDEYQKVKEELRAPVHVVFIVQLPNIAGGCYTGFQCGVWHSVHIDDLSMEDLNLPAIDVMQSTSVSNLIHDAVKGPVAMETGDEEEYRNTREAMEWQDELSPSADRDVEEGMDTQDPAPSASLKGNTMSQTQGPLDIEDVILGFESAGKKIAPIKEYQGRSLNVKDLILSCTQAALSLLKDKAENNQRTTERVALVLTLFHGTHLQGYELFLQGMCSLIASLLKEKEKNVYSPENWLTNEAAKPENIQKAGTFRRSCLQTLESKISPILAGIIAHLDTNQNLDILDSSQSQWKHQLWLYVLNVPGALQLKYSDLQSPKRQTDLQEVVVITTGCEGRIFKSSMPFSWLIHQQMNEIVRQPMPPLDENELREFTDKIVFYGGLFEQTSLGKVLAQYSNSEHVTEIAEEYLHDFLCMLYSSSSEEEFKLVSQSMRYKYNQLIDKIEGMATLIHHLLCIHEAYKILAPRLAYFHTMNVVWPECSVSIEKVKQENPEHIMFREEEFTFSSLCMLIENLTPSKNELDKPEGRSKWLNKVHTFRPVVDKVLRLHREDEASYGAHSYQSVQRARCLWSRVVVMKLFLEHICTVPEEENITVKYFMPMWKVLGDEANLQEIKSLEAIEKILKLCNKKAIQEFLGKQEKCGYCEIELDGPPIVLPCGDLFCDKCFQDIKALGDDSCLKCQKTIPEGWSVERQTEKMTEKLKLKNYQKRCNSFFMDVVSQLCFYDNTPPSDSVIDRLLEYITHTTKGVERTQKTVTKEMTIFNTGLDPNPVFRSFLLQLLMRMSEQKVMENLKKYLEHADSLLKQTDGTDNESYINLGLLVIQCLEDILTQEMSPLVEVEEGIKCLKRARDAIFTDELNIEKLYGLAEARIGLRIAAKAIAGLVQQQGGNYNVRRLIEAAQTLCENGHTEFPRIYLVKYMCRCYGIDVYQAACQSEKRYLMWIGMKGREYNQGVEMSDRLVLCGDTYTSIREALTKVVLGEDCDSLNETLQELRTSKSHVHILFPLAVYREITCSLLYPPAQRKVKDKEVDVLQNFIQNSQDFKDKTGLLRCLQNNIGHPSCFHLTVREGLDFRLQGVQCLLVHFLCVISHLDGNRTVLQPLIGLFKTPQEFANSFLPTMPQDDLEDVKEALLAARQNDGGENPVFYRCPNGHPYVIGNCGRPATVGLCKECGSAIGGEGYQLRPGNIQHQGVDETQTGHILGHPRVRGQGPRPEREMSPPFCACVRLLTHMSMYLGTLNNIQAIHGMIIPALHGTDVSEYLWGHIQVDLDDLQRGLGKSPDDVFVLLHTVVDNMMNKHDKGERVPEVQCRLSSKNGRRVWEKRMCDQYLQPIFKDSNQILQQANKRIVDDQRLGADPLLCLLYEIDTQQEEENPNKLEIIPAVWRYRSPITIEHLRHEFEAKKLSLSKRDKQLKVLDLFLKEEHYLRAIRCIPSILKLQRELFNTYQRKLDKAEASQITVGHVIREKIAGEDSSQLVDDFIIAWNICRSSLKQYLCPTDLGGMPVPKDYCGPISEETPIAILLPAIKDEGLCSYALMDLLMRKQNDFLEKYFKETAKSKKRSPDHMTKVQPMDVTPAHLISYDPQQDLLPLILANCQYSFEIGKGTKIEYDFTSLERQIMDRFLFSKSKIDVGPVLKIDLMTYRAEFTNGEVFKKLEEKIPQDGLSSAVKTQICAEMRTMPDLCQSLYTLDISISFLKSIGGNPNDNLHRFMADTLKMKETILSQKARQTCCFTHIQSLWLLLALEKSKKMAEHRQPMENMFDSVSQEFQEHLPADIEATFRDFMKDISVDKLGGLVALLHEYILLRVAAVQNRDDEDYTDTTNLKLQEWLPEYSEGLDRGDNLEQILAGFPDTILYKHSVHAWVTAYSMLCEKQTGDKKF